MPPRLPAPVYCGMGGFLFDDYYLWSHGTPGREETPRWSSVHGILMEYVNRSKEATIDQTLGHCQLSEIIRSIINDMAVNYMRLSHCCSGRKRLGAALPLRVMTR